MRTRPNELKGGVRTISGAVSASGGIVQGTGFSVVRVSLGHYTVTFDKPFKAPPIIVISGTDQTAGNYQAVIDPLPTTVTPKQFGPVASTPGSSYVDMAFTFTATEQVPA